MAAPLAPMEPRLIEGTLASVMNPDGVVVRRKKEPSSMQLRKNGVLPFQSAVWCHETEVVDGVERVHIKHPCQGWINKDEIIVGQIAIINSLVGATVREDIEIDSPVVGELPYESRVFITEQDETKDGKPRACVFAPLQGWVSVKCLAPICDRMGDVLAAGKKVLEPTDVEGKNVVFSHYTEVNHELMYKALWDSGLMYGPGFQLCKKAFRTDTDAIGMVGPLPGEAVGWLVHPALADSMLHLTAVAPKPPEGGWPWMSEDEREGRVKGIND
jgi:hypothetical protein|mmetsp:Transcript_12443/g.42348  ORF Transcript_12443/g.42348 Transcript_12443/m.42348 type:complete len:272 (-) Transcript_12443:93-908(-)